MMMNDDGEEAFAPVCVSAGFGLNSLVAVVVRSASST
jgi:hypothetical protein